MVEPDTSDVHLATSPRLFAGFTFIGQFIDHDITLDTTPLDQQLADPDATVNFRTPRYDLDSVYGRGPAQDPQFYDPADPDKLLLRPNVNGVLDVPRDGNGRAIIGDPRNDENLIIVQFHKAVVQFHNRIVDYARALGHPSRMGVRDRPPADPVALPVGVIHDFLPRFVGDELVGPNGTVYKEVAGKPPVINLNYYKPTNRDGRPFMPVEFAVAAYRFGHSLIRPFYVINDTGIVDIFGPAGGRNLNGGRPIPADLVIEWKNILPVDPNFQARKPRKIDTKLSIPLTTFPGPPSRPPTRRSTWPSATTAGASRSACRRGSRSRRRCGSPRCPTQRSGSPIRDGAARRRCGSTSSRRPSCRRTMVSGSGRWAAGSWPRSSSGSCSGTRTRTCTSTPPGNPPHRSRRRPASSPSSTCCDTRAPPDRQSGLAASRALGPAARAADSRLVPETRPAGSGRGERSQGPLEVASEFGLRSYPRTERHANGTDHGLRPGRSGCSPVDEPSPVGLVSRVSGQEVHRDDQSLGIVSLERLRRGKRVRQLYPTGPGSTSVVIIRGRMPAVYSETAALYGIG